MFLIDFARGLDDVAFACFCAHLEEVAISRATHTTVRSGKKGMNYTHAQGGGPPYEAPAAEHIWTVHT